MKVKMSDEFLKAIQYEYKESVRMKSNALHSRWTRIMEGYRTNSFEEILRYLTDRLPRMDDMAILASNGNVPKLHLIVRKLTALLNMSNAQFAVETPNLQDEAIGWLLESSTNALLPKIRYSRTMREALVHAAVFGTGIVKTGYSSEYVYDETAYTGKISKDRREELGDEGVIPEGDETEYTDDAIKTMRPALFTVKPWDIFFNLGCRELKRVRCVYHRSLRPLVDICGDDRYDKTAREMVPGVMPDELEAPTFMADSHEIRNYLQMGEVVERYDPRTRTYCIFSPGIDKPLKDITAYPFKECAPYRFLQLIPDPESPWGMPYAGLFDGPCTAINQINSYTIDAIGRNGKRINLYDPADIETEDMEAIRAAPDNANVPVTGLSGLRQKYQDKSPFFPLDSGGPAPEMLQLKNEFVAEVNEASMLTDQSRNASASQDPTATQAAMRQNQQDVSVEDFRDLYEEFQERVAGDLFQIMLQRWPEQEMVNVVGNDPRLSFWVPLERDRVSGNFQLKIAVGSTEKMDKVTQRRQLTDLAPRIQMLVQMVDQEAMAVRQGLPPSPIDKLELLRIFMEAYNPRWADRVLRSRDPVMLAQRLIQQHGMSPAGMSPDMMSAMERVVGQQAGQINAPAPDAAMAPPANVIPMQDPRLGGGAPMEAPQNPMQGQMRQDQNAAVSGRAMSESRSR